MLDWWRCRLASGSSSRASSSAGSPQDLHG
jgi:hypothetical protein